VKCGAQSAPASYFCGRCRTRLDTAALISAQTQLRDRSLAGERRHLTVLFCDLVNSTSIAAQLDPEEWRDIVADYRRRGRWGRIYLRSTPGKNSGSIIWPNDHGQLASKASIRSPVASLA
jgi:hypothetical protein